MTTLTSRQDADNGAPRPSAEVVGSGRPVRAWAALLAVVAGRCVRAFVLTLATAAVLPMAWQWSSYVVRTGSMEPAIAPGDVVVARPFSAEDPVPLGRVMVLSNPAIPDGSRLLVHRVVESLADGRYVTAGDANADTDATPAERGDFRARAVLRVPWVGLPVVWLSRGRYLPVAATVVVVVLAFLAAGGHLPGGPRRPAGRTRGDRSGRRRRLRPRRLPAVSRRALPLVGVVAVAVAGSVGATQVSAAFTDVTATSSNTWTVAGNLVQPYVAEVLADDPSVFHLLDERSGAWANDASTSHRTGAYGSVSAYRVPGALPNNPGTAVRLGGTGRVVTGGQAWQNPRRFSLELWFKTSTDDGGKLIGFEGTRDVWSYQADRHLHMRPDGRLVYGGWSILQMRTITTPRAYNDGTWHHVVLTAEPHGQEQDAVMYVDGAPVVSGTTTRTSSYAGWWRVGYGSLPLWFGFPSGAFDGVVDQVAVYDSVLSADRVRAHYDAR